MGSTCHTEDQGGGSKTETQDRPWSWDHPNGSSSSSQEDFGQRQVLWARDVLHVPPQGSQALSGMDGQSASMHLLEGPGGFRAGALRLETRPFLRREFWSGSDNWIVLYNWIMFSLNQH